eukprot:1693130-Prymnesium_polylepis.1
MSASGTPPAKSGTTAMPIVAPAVGGAWIAGRSTGAGAGAGAASCMAQRPRIHGRPREVTPTWLWN